MNMDMDMGLEHSSSQSSSSVSTYSPEWRTAWPWPAKRPAGRTKFRETRHPVFRGVRRRGGAGRWVCEVRVPGGRGTRLWLGTYVTAEAAARAHDAAMLALRGRSGAACLNFSDSAWLLAVPPAVADLADVRRAAVQAVADFQRREAASGAAVQEVTSSVSAPSSAHSANAHSSETSEPSADGAFEVSAALDSDMFGLDLFEETELDTYYASLAQGLLMEPPPQPQTPAAGAYWDHEDCGDGGADVALWSY